MPQPQPVLGKQGVAKLLRGIVLFRLPGTKEFVPLVDLTAIPNGTEIDARKGRLLITVLHDASGQLDGARFYAGRFIFRQGKGETPITTLKLTGGSFKNCTVRAQASLRARRRRQRQGRHRHALEAARAQALGLRPRPLPHARALRRRDGARHEVADARPLRRHEGARGARQGQRAGPRAPEPQAEARDRPARKTFVPYKRGG